MHEPVNSAIYGIFKDRFSTAALVSHLLNFLQQNSVSHELDLRIVSDVSFVTNLVRYFSEKKKND